MEALVSWFQPLLWILGTITTLGLFIRFCDPVWKFFKSPEKLSQELVKLDTKITAHFDDIEVRLDKYDDSISLLMDANDLSTNVNQALLRDRLQQGYHHYKAKGSMPHGAYRALCEMHEIYNKCNGNSYTDAVMEEIHALYRNQENPHGGGPV